MKAAVIAAIVAAIIAAGSATAAITHGVSPSKVTIRQGPAWPIAPGGTRSAEADCPVGEAATGGGGNAAGGTELSSEPVITPGNKQHPNQWEIFVENTTSDTISITASVVCVAS